MLTPIPTTGTIAEGAPVGSGVAQAGTKAGGLLSRLPGAPANVELIVDGTLLDPKLAYFDEHYQNMMQLAGEIHTLGVLAGVIDGPTEEMRAAIKKAAGTYFDNLLKVSRRTDLSGFDSPLDVVTVTGGGLLSLGGRLDAWAGRKLQSWSNEGDTLHGVGTWLVGAGEHEQDIGHTMVVTDPNDVLNKVVGDFLKSVWDDCKKRYEQFWKDTEKEGILSALQRLKADAEWVAAGIAIDIGLGIVTGGMATAVSIIVRRSGRMMSKVVFKLAAKATRIDAPRPDIDLNDNVFEMDLPDEALDKKIVNQAMDEDHLRTRSSREDLSDRADVDNPDVEKPEGGGGSKKSPPKDKDVETELEPPPDNAPPFVAGRNPNDPPGVWRDHDGNAVLENGTLKNGNPKYTPVRHMDTNAKGNFGEVMGDRDMLRRKYDQVYPTNSREIGDSSTGQGIDSIFRDPGPPERFIVTESKFRSGDPFTPPFPDTNDGPQMGAKWLRVRLETIAGTDRALLRRLVGPPRPQRIVQRVGPDGRVQNIDLQTGLDIDTGKQIFSSEKLKGLSWR